MTGEASQPAAGASPRSTFVAKDAMATWMQEIAPYGILTTDRDLQILSWNEWLVTHSGLSGAEVVGRRLTEVFAGLDEHRVTERFTQALAGEVSLLSTALHRYLLPFPATMAESGSPFMLQTARIAPLRDGESIVGTITIIEDVTQREVHASILRRQQEMDRLLSTSLATLLQASDPAHEISGIFATLRPSLRLDAYVSLLASADGKTLTLHASAGISPQQRVLLGRLELSDADQKLMLTEAPPPVLSIASHLALLRSIGLKGICSFPLVIGSRSYGLLAFGSYDRDELTKVDTMTLTRIARYIAMALDRATREKDTMLASRAKDDFLAALSHELRTPLNPVLLVASDSAQNERYSLEVRESFSMIEKNVLLEARLIDDLLDLTKIERGKLSLDLRTVDLHSVLSDAVQTIASDIKEKNLALTQSLTARDSAVHGDAGRLQQIFWNILKNAVKFTPVEGKIWITSANDLDGGIVMTFRDTGIGMDSAELTRVFGAFAQGDHASGGRSHRFGGLGLGLAISRKLVELHGGRIEATSEGKAKGSTFTLYLPSAQSTASAPPAASSTTAFPLATSGQSKRLLLVEDHEPTRTSLETLLRRRGFEVTAVANCSDALREAFDTHFDLVLSDIGLPDGDGFELMRDLRRIYSLRGIALTGYGMDEDVVRSRDAGFFAHLTKPVEVKALDRALEAVFAAAP